MRNELKRLIEKLERKIPYERSIKILRLILKQYEARVCTGLNWLRMKSSEGSSEHSNKHICCIKYGKFDDQQATFRFSKRTCSIKLINYSKFPRSKESRIVIIINLSYFQPTDIANTTDKYLSHNIMDVLLLHILHLFQKCLNLEIAGSSKTWVSIYEDTLRHIPENAILIIILSALCNVCQEQKSK
jgi:hypothetical protein